SAAKKEEYEAICYVRQLLLFLVSLGICMRRSARGRIIAVPCAPRKRYFLRQIKGNRPGTAIAYMNTCTDHQGEQLWARQQHWG
ncbi:hypothetical protein O0881_29165, partial [Janthinobacterium sp. SUN100]|uniref:hypothetical protein n=1 Tax=Janthinobacterium sp. SUN100 TaxID=3004101 RepID=UPI0025B12B85